MSFGDHLDELRKRLLLALAAPLPLFIVLFLFSHTLIEWLVLPVYDVLHAQGLPPDLQVLSPPEFIVTQLKVSAIGAVIVSMPWIIWQAWQFIAPGLYQHERRFVYYLIPGSAILTVAGATLLYFAMLPLMLHVLVMFAADMEVGLGPSKLPAEVTAALETIEEVPVLTAPPEPLRPGEAWLRVPEMQFEVAITDPETGDVIVFVVPEGGDGRIEQHFRLSWVINFTLILLLGVVIAFQMPLVILLLGWIGFVSVDMLRRNRRYALAICGLVSAIVTPADAVSMLLMLVPLYGLYELGIILLVLTPASAVAEGRIMSRWPLRRSDKASERSSHPRKPVQSATSVPRAEPPSQPSPPRTDQDQ
jgi:sec-independent protein translocase protein TatC